MIAKQTVYLDATKTKAVPEGHADARFLLVREGAEIDEKEFEQYEGADKLIGSEAKHAKDEHDSKSDHHKGGKK